MTHVRGKTRDPHVVPSLLCLWDRHSWKHNPHSLYIVGPPENYPVRDSIRW